MASIVSYRENSRMKHLSFGNWLKHMRLVHGMTQRQLEQAAELSEKYVSRIERKGTVLPEEDLRFRIHRVFGTTEDDLVDAGILVRLESPVEGGGSVYISAASVARELAEEARIDAEQQAHFRRELIPHPDEIAATEDDRSRLIELMRGIRLTPDRTTTLRTMLESFRDQDWTGTKQGG